MARDLTIPLLDEPRWRRQICGLSLLGMLPRHLLASSIQVLHRRTDYIWMLFGAGAPQLVVFKFSHPSKIAAGGMPLALLVFLISLPIALAVYTYACPQATRLAPAGSIRIEATL